MVQNESELKKKKTEKKTQNDIEVKQNECADAPTFTCGRKDEGITVGICMYGIW